MGFLPSACTPRSNVGERQHGPAPASSWVPPGTCLPDAAASLERLDRKTNAELEKLSNHYFNCVDDQRLSLTGTIASLEERGRRGDARSAGGLAALYKYKPNPEDRRHRRNELVVKIDGAGLRAALQEGGQVGRREVGDDGRDAIA